MKIVNYKDFFILRKERNEKWSASKHSGQGRSRKKPPKQPVPINSITIWIQAQQLWSSKVKEASCLLVKEAAALVQLLQQAHPTNSPSKSSDPNKMDEEEKDLNYPCPSTASLMAIHIANQVQQINKALPSGPTKCWEPQSLQVIVMLFISTHLGSANHYPNHC
jgi:hypothetical protein